VWPLADRDLPRPFHPAADPSPRPRTSGLGHGRDGAPRLGQDLRRAGGPGPGRSLLRAGLPVDATVSRPRLGWVGRVVRPSGPADISHERQRRFPPAQPALLEATTQGISTLPLLVQKFGGTSVADSDKILAAARRAIRAHQRGDQVLVVVSARGHTTDELIALAKEISERPPAREMDMLLSTGEQVSVALMAMAIQALGVPAISFTGAQIGLVTDSFHTKARIRNISTERMVQALDEGKIVIVAGFQGIDADYNITTLGRGGSDTTAVALAAVLGGDGCEIYTDVDGVYTTDPRVV